MEIASREERESSPPGSVGLARAHSLTKTEAMRPSHRTWSSYGLPYPLALVLKESVSDLQALLGDMPEMTPEAAQRLRSMGGFNMLHFRSHIGAASDHDIPVVDRFDLLRQATVWGLSLAWV